MSVARRPLLTATAAGTLLCALWFVPSANATGDQGAAPAQRSAPSAQSLTVDGAEISEVTDAADTTDSSVAPAEEAPAGAGADGEAGGDAGAPRLADTGGVDTTPYVVGGSLSLAVGVGFVAYSVRRSVRAF
ncbi:hypothetical protein [Streptomyces sp. NPDC059134]|uniref:hypothetical protein n=1 Tax=Streptomyces sp. NPDC059134 TaxID=3346738 RepID=UPI0036BB1941